MQLKKKMDIVEYDSLALCSVWITNLLNVISVMEKREIFDLIKQSKLDELKQILKEHPDCVHLQDDQGISPLLMAAYYKNQDALHMIREKTERLDLHEAAAYGDLDELVRNLEEYPGRINSFSPDGFTALGLASYFNHKNIVDYLLARNARVNMSSRNEMSVTPLHSAVNNASLSTVRTLLDHNADPNAPQMFGLRPAHTAAKKGRLDILKYLMRKGADVSIEDSKGKTAVDYAREEGHKEVVSYLKEALKEN